MCLWLSDTPGQVDVLQGQIQTSEITWKLNETRFALRRPHLVVLVSLENSEGSAKRVERVPEFGDEVDNLLSSSCGRRRLNLVYEIRKHSKQDNTRVSANLLLNKNG